MINFIQKYGYPLPTTKEELKKRIKKINGNRLTQIFQIECHKCTCASFNGISCYTIRFYKKNLKGFDMELSIITSKLAEVEGAQ